MLQYDMQYTGDWSREKDLIVIMIVRYLEAGTALPTVHH